MSTKFEDIYNKVTNVQESKGRNEGIGYCGCVDCSHNDKTGNCMIEEVNLDYSKDESGRVICECKTYTRGQ